MERFPRPLPGMILVEPVSPPKIRNLYAGANPRYPTSGFVWNLPSAYSGLLRIGDFVGLEEHGIEQPNLTHDTFFLRLRDSTGWHIVRADRDIEPVIREVVERVRRGVDGDRHITVKDIDRENEPVRFLASEVVDYGIGAYTESGYSLSYRHHVEVHPIDTRLDHPKLILVPEGEILFTIRREELIRAKNQTENG